MANLKKYTNSQISYVMKHNTREHPFPPSNVDIDSSLSDKNYYLTDVTCADEAMDLYKKRLSEVYRYKRSDVITACSWICTAPQDLPKEEEYDFFKATHEYLNSLYGAENCIVSSVHYDEGVRNEQGEIVEGRPHLHYVFIPVVDNDKYGLIGKTGPLASSKYEEKLGANQLIRKNNLLNFHPDYQSWIDSKDIHATVYSGVTNGKNRTIEALKAETKSQLKSQEQVHEWGLSGSWGQERQEEWTR